jgi:hypothetical protein
MITLNVPFVYEAIVIKSGCRKPSLIAIKDEVQVQIQTTTLDKLPTAFKVGDESIRWDKNRLWNYYLETIAEQPSRKVGITEVIKNTNSNGAFYKWSRSGAAAPFKNFWHDLQWSKDRLGLKYKIKECGFDKWLTDYELIEKSDVVCREWVEDNRERVIEKLNKIVNGIMSVDGIMFCLAAEPRYEVVSFGAGSNYSVAMFVSYGYNNNISNKCYFSSLGFKKAQEALLARSPDKSLVAEPNGGHRIEVLIPDAVNCNPVVDHVA